MNTWQPWIIANQRLENNEDNRGEAFFSAVFFNNTERVKMAKLSTKYLGLEIKSPLIASASALSKKVDNIKRMEDAGLGAVVMVSLFILLA